MRSLLTDIVVSLVIVLLQTLVIPHLAVATIVPDAILIWIVYLALVRGPITATLAGFLLGLLFDALAGGSGMMGLSSLTKSVSGFVAGYAYSETKMQQTLSGFAFVVLTAGISLLHNLLYFLVFLQGTDLSWNSIVLRYGVTTTLYTTAASLLPMFAFARKYRS